jgi:hypothetical protein
LEIDTHKIFYNTYNNTIFPKLKFNQDSSTLDITTSAIQVLFDISFRAGINFYKPYEFSYKTRDVMTSGLLKKYVIINNIYIKNMPEVDLIDILEQGFIEGLNAGLQSSYFSG